MSDPFLAYVDPGTGSYLLQVLAGALLGAGLVVKAKWRQLKAAVARLFGRGGTA